MDDLDKDDGLAQAAAEAADAAHANEQQQRVAAKVAAAAAALQHPGEYQPEQQEEQQPPQRKHPPPQQQVVGDTDETTVCRICGKCSDSVRQVMVRFHPVVHPPAIDPATLATVSTWNEDISVHIFCGKTATILPSVNKPELEILSKAGVKNKHGIGADVNAALARTRFATNYKCAPGSKEKVFYLVKEVEAHLQQIRNVHLLQQQQAEAEAEAQAEQAAIQQQQSLYSLSPTMASAGMEFSAAAAAVAPGYQPHQQPPYQHHQETTKVVPHKAAAGQVYNKPRSSKQKQQQQQQQEQQQQQQPWSMMPPSHMDLAAGTAAAAAAAAIGQQQQQQQPYYSIPAQADDSLVEEGMMTSDGKIKCGCGGTHLPTHTPKGAASWRNHVMTKRHQKWMEDNGLLGAV